MAVRLSEDFGFPKVTAAPLRTLPEDLLPPYASQAANHGIKRSLDQIYPGTDEEEAIFYQERKAERRWANSDQLRTWPSTRKDLSLMAARCLSLHEFIKEKEYYELEKIMEEKANSNRTPNMTSEQSSRKAIKRPREEDLDSLEDSSNDSRVKRPRIEKNFIQLDEPLEGEVKSLPTESKSNEPVEKHVELDDEFHIYRLDDFSEAIFAPAQTAEKDDELDEVPIIRLGDDRDDHDDPSRGEELDLSDDPSEHSQGEELDDEFLDDLGEDNSSQTEDNDEELEEDSLGDGVPSDVVVATVVPPPKAKADDDPMDEIKLPDHGDDFHLPPFQQAFAEPMDLDNANVYIAQPYDGDDDIDWEEVTEELYEENVQMEGEPGAINALSSFDSVADDMMELAIPAQCYDSKFDYQQHK